MARKRKSHSAAFKGQVALEEALRRGGCPEVFNTDQGVQFTTPSFTGRLEAAGAQLSMDGKGRWLDNVFVERLWRTVKYEYVYLWRPEAVPALRSGLQTYFGYYALRTLPVSATTEKYLILVMSIVVPVLTVGDKYLRVFNKSVNYNEVPRSGMAMP
jgi:transposase InsO family protein